jgi:hypothetical protein
LPIYPLRGGGVGPITARKVGDHVEIEEDEARAGSTGMGLRYMLIGGVILAIAGFALAASMLLG